MKKRSMFLNEIKRRLDFQFEVIKSPDVKIRNDVDLTENSLLSSLSCLEQTANKACYTSLKIGKIMMDFMTRQEHMNKVYFALMGENEIVNNLQLPRKDPMNFLDIRAEATYMEWMRRTNNSEAALNRLKLEFPYVKFQE